MPAEPSGTPAPLDVAALRAETPGCAHRVHLNNAGAALPTRRTLDTVVDHLHLESEIGGYEAAAARAEERPRCGRRLRTCSASEDEVALTTSDTSADQGAVGVRARRRPRSSRRVVVDHAVYNSHYLSKGSSPPIGASRSTSCPPGRTEPRSGPHGAGSPRRRRC
jgi:hypothetical protein